MPKGDRLKLKADPEDGMASVPNLLLDAISIVKLAGLEMGAIMYLLRATYGNQQNEARISLTEWAEALDTNRTTASRILSKLEAKRIIKRHQTKIWDGYFYCVNTVIAEWDDQYIEKNLLSQNINICVRCGRTEQIENHHIKPKAEGGGENPTNKEPRCSVCHDYEHARRNILASLEKAQRQKQSKRISVFQNRLQALEELNTPELIRQRGNYQSWWQSNENLHYLPPYERNRQKHPTQATLCLANVMEERQNGTPQKANS